MSGPTLTLKQGKILGKTSKNANGNQFFSFQGIPYAKPPVGELRFKPPQPAEPWSGTFDATKEGNQCYSRHMLFKDQLRGSEDCLILNVYTPNIPSDATKNIALKPVMVFIHGGGFTSGSSSTELYGPEFLLTQDVVLVTINYRVGILGFFRLNDTSLGVTGNAGMKDQVLALRWVQDNIKNFGGDPGNVTIFGESAGSGAVHYLVLSPLAKNLFHKAIAQSGAAINPFAQSKYVALELADSLKLGTSDERKILEHLIALPVEKLHEASEQIQHFIGYNGMVAYAPCVEAKVEGAFITEEPIDMIRSGNYNQVPLIFGYTSREGMLYELIRKPIEHPRDFERMVPRILGLQYGSAESKAVAEKIKNFYYKNGENIDNYYLIHGDNMFVRDIQISVINHAKTSKSPVYLYRMTVETTLNIFKKFGNITNPGVCHGDDLGYLFKTQVTPEIKPGSLEEITMKRFLKLWTNFAKYGNPNPEKTDELIPVKWEPVKEEHFHYLEIGENLKVGEKPDEERMKFWRDIFKNSPKYKF